MTTIADVGATLKIPKNILKDLYWNLLYLMVFLEFSYYQLGREK